MSLIHGLMKGSFIAVLSLFFIHTFSHAQNERASILTVIKVSQKTYESIVSNSRFAITSSTQESDSVLVTMQWPDVYALQEQGVELRIITFDINDNSVAYQSYPTYDQVVTELKNYASSNPTLCTYEVIGKTQGGKDIPALTITKDKDNGKVRPLYWVSGATHGNEEMGTVTVMAQIKSLVSGYSHDPISSKMVEQAEWHMVPILNVDGYLAVRRTLNNGNDPNRSLGWQVGYKNGADASGQGVVVEPITTVEIQTYALQFTKYPCVLGVDYHTGQVATYAPWFADHDQKPEDQEAYQAIGKFFTAAGDGALANGGNMEKKGMPGIQTDYGYSKSGTLTMCLELCAAQGGLPSNATSIAEKHVKAFQDVFTETQKGVMGKITDKETKKPLYARISVKGCGADIFSSPITGGYFKYTPKIPSSVDVTVVSNGYKTSTVHFSTDRYGNITTKDFEMEKDPNGKVTAMSIDCIRCYNYMSLTEARQCLGLRDGKATTIQANGGNKAYVIVDMGPNTPIKDTDGKEITVVVTGSGAYSLYAAKTLDGVTKASSLKKVGDGSGTSDFDLKTAGIDQAQYLRVEVASGSIQLDAIEASYSQNTALSQNGQNLKVHQNRIYSNALSQHLSAQFFIPQGTYDISLYSMKGSKIQTVASGYCVANTTKSFIWNKADLLVKSGVYNMRITTSNTTNSYKLFIQ